MKIQVENKAIKLNRFLSILDEFVLDFVEVLDRLRIKYVIISGYIPLLFGRQRITEDVDIFLEDLDQSKIEELYKELLDKYWCLNASSGEIFINLWKEKIPLRVAKKDQISPNMEVKQLVDEFSSNAMENAVEIVLNGKHKIKISPLELQIAYKLYLGSKKDLEDARFLYDLFKNNLDKKTIVDFANKLDVSKKIRYLGDMND